VKVQHFRVAPEVFALIASLHKGIQRKRALADEDIVAMTHIGKFDITVMTHIAKCLCLPMTAVGLVHIWCCSMPFELGKASFCCYLAQVLSSM